MTSADSTILVTGATGFLGARLAAHLLAEGDNVVALVRRESATLEELRRSHGDRLRLVKFDLLTGEGDLPEKGAVDAMACCAVVYNSAGYGVSENVELARTQTLIQRRLDIPKCVFVSSQNVEFSNRGPYSRSKALGERVFQEETTGILQIVRPTLIYDETGNSFFRQLADIAQRSRFVPHLGLRSPVLQPVFLGDLCDIIRKTMEFDAPEIITVYSGASLSLADISHQVRRRYNAIAVVRAPMPALKLLSWASAQLKDKLGELYEDKTVEPKYITAFEARFGLKLHCLIDDLPDILDALA